MPRSDGRQKELALRFAGAGGHGIVFAGRWIGTALVLEGYEVSLRPYYSPAQRGGWSKCDMVLSVDEEMPPIIDEVDVLVVTLQSLYFEEIGNVKKGGVIVLESDAIKERGARSDVIEIPYPAFKTSLEITGRDRYGNAALVGFVCGYLGLVNLDSLIEALKKLRVKEFEENVKVVKKGFEDGSKARKHIIPH